MKCDIYTVKAHSWPDVVSYYCLHKSEQSLLFGPMCAFVTQIAQSRYADAVYPTTSVYRLIISQTPEFEWKREVLEVEFFTEPQRFQFDFWEDPYARTHWSRQCAAGDAFALFEGLMRSKNWFTF